MIIGIGTDILTIERMATAYERKGDALATRILHPREMALWQQKGAPIAWLAKRFAAKEALMKALGTGLGHGISWHHMCILPTSMGRPEVEWFGAAQDVIQALAKTTIDNTATHISISDERDQAIAFAVIEKIAA